MRVPCRVLVCVVSLVALAGGAVANTPASEEREATMTTKTPQFWFEDNNVRRAGGYPADMREMFEQPEKWAELRERVDVYYIRGNTLRNLFNDFGDDFMRDHFARVLGEANIPIAIDNAIGLDESIPKLRSYGLTVSHVALQSVLSKGPPVSEEEMDRRIEATIKQLVEIKQNFPNIQIGFICALPTKGRAYKEPYRRIAQGLKRAGHRLDFIQLDCPYPELERGARIDWPGAAECQRYVQEEIGADFGFICTSTAGLESEERFYRDVMKILDHYPRGVRPPEHFVLMSWYHHPALSLPEDAPEGSYPMTKVGRDFARKLGVWQRSDESILEGKANQ